MSADISQDQFAIIRVDGMHCHKCERTLSKALQQCPGVFEVEVDFNSGLASVLHNPNVVTLHELSEAVSSAGYRFVGATQGNMKLDYVGGTT